MKFLLVQIVEHKLEDAIIGGIRTDFQLGHFIEIVTRIRRRFIWLTPLYLSRFLKYCWVLIDKYSDTLVE